MAVVSDEVTDLSRQVQVQTAKLYRELIKLGRQYETAREKAKAIRDEAEPIIVALAWQGQEQGKLAELFRVVRETIRRIEMSNGVDRGDPRARPRETPVARPDPLPEIVLNRSLRRLGTLGGHYETARDRVKGIRVEAEPIIVALARMGEEQGKIAVAFRVVRETIRRIEMSNGVDRGDPRAKPRIAKPGKEVRRVGRPRKAAG